MKDDEGRPLRRPATTNTTTCIAIVAPGGDIERARRRLRLHHVLWRRPRWSNELDGLCAEDRSHVGTYLGGDYWADVHMNLGVREREMVGVRRNPGGGA